MADKSKAVCWAECTRLLRQSLLPEKRMLFQPNLAKAAGSDYIAKRIEELRPMAHVFGALHSAESCCSMADVPASCFCISTLSISECVVIRYLAVVYGMSRCKITFMLWRAQGIRTSRGTMCWMAYGTSSGRCRTRKSERAWLLCSVINPLSYEKRGILKDISSKEDDRNKLNLIARDVAAPHYQHHASEQAFWLGE